ncbi:LacI family transcriptional regulator, partial [Streptomyces sp. SID7499]|nr:LacI family transcriptional regulator [Streptomyces sp. SID7499]
VHHFGAEVARSLFSLIEGTPTGDLRVPTPSLTPRGSTAPAPQQ